MLGSGSSLVLANYLSYFNPSTNNKVASPPSSTIESGPFPSGHIKAFNVHSQYSSSVSPFQAKTVAV